MSIYGYGQQAVVVVVVVSVISLFYFWTSTHMQSYVSYLTCRWLFLTGSSIGSNLDSDTVSLFMFPFK